MWHSEARVVLEPETEYKYVVCDSDGKAFRWEERPNRRVGARACRAFVISEIFDCCSGFDECTPGASPDSAAKFQHSASLALRVFHATRKFKRAINPLKEMDSTQLSPLGEASPSQQPPAAERRMRFASMAGLPPRAATNGAPRARPSLLRELGSSESFEDGSSAKPGALFHDKFNLVGQGPLGEGSFGLVWKCERKTGDGGEAMAAKIMKKQRLSRTDLANIMGPGGELEVHVGLRHENIVRLFEHFNEEQTVTLVMEHCAGGDLFDAVADQLRATGWGLPERECAAGLRQLTRGVEYLHAQQVVHRDLKCENVLLTRRGVPLQDNRLKICDFGFAAFDRGDGLNDRMGSPDTVAPEVVRGKRYSFPVDLWAVGVISYMTLSAKSPFCASSDVEVLRRVKTGKYTFGCSKWDTVTDTAKATIASLLMLDPSLRPGARDALQLPWLAGP